MNAEIFLIFPTDKKDVYKNHTHKFEGSIADAQEYARKHNFGGGVEICSIEKVFPFKREYTKI